jgi:CHAT domain-containing protein
MNSVRWLLNCLKRRIFQLSTSRLRRSYIGLGLLSLLLVTTSFPVVAQHTSSAAIEQRQLDVSTQLQQGKTLYQAGRFSEAATIWQQAAQNYEKQGDRFSQSLSLSYLSLAYQDLGQWQEAQKAIQQSLELLENTPQPTPERNLILAQVLNARGSLQLAIGQTEAALKTWKQAESAYAAARDETGILGSKINQAQALQVLGLYRRAQATLEQVNQKLQTQPDSLLKAAGLQSLGVALQAIGDLQKSQDVLKQSLATQERLGSSPDISTTLFSLGNTARALQDYKKAIAFYQQAAAKATSGLDRLEAQLNQLSLLVQTKQWSVVQALLPKIQSNLSNLPANRSAIYAQVNLAESLLEMRRASPRMQQTISLSSPSELAQLLVKVLQQGRTLKDTRAESYALGELGKLYEYTQQWTEARNLTQDALSLAQAINADDITYRWQWQLGRILKQQGHGEPGASNTIVEAIAAYSEAVNTLKSLRTDLVAIDPDVQFSFRESVEPIYRELVELLLEFEPSQANLEQAREVIESLQLAQLDNFFREACLRAKPEQIDRVEPTAAVIYPIILPDRLAVILSLPGKSLRYYQTRLPQSAVEDTIEQLLQSLNPVFSNKERLRLSQEVYDWLIRPAQDQLAASGVKTLVFVLDGSLQNLSMAALYDGQQYLVEKYSIALSPGLQLLEPRSLKRQQLKALMGGLTEGRQGFASLPAVQLELNQIASDVRSEILLNQRFTKQGLEQQINDAPFPIIHLATHAQFSSKAENTFLLTWDGRINVKEFDSLLRTRERQDTNPIELLVLSACQTATGDKRAALGLAGLAVRSGARSTLATLWSVRDRSTAALMAEFYQKLTQTEVSKAEALRQAQLALLKNSQYQHPYYWAPFVLVGNWL